MYTFRYRPTDGHPQSVQNMHGLVQMIASGRYFDEKNKKRELRSGQKHYIIDFARLTRK